MKKNNLIWYPVFLRTNWAQFNLETIRLTLILFKKIRNINRSNLDGLNTHRKIYIEFNIFFNTNNLSAKKRRHFIPNISPLLLDHFQFNIIDPKILEVQLKDNSIKGDSDDGWEIIDLHYFEKFEKKIDYLMMGTIIDMFYDSQYEEYIKKKEILFFQLKNYYEKEAKKERAEKRARNEAKEEGMEEEYFEEEYFEEYDFEKDYFKEDDIEKKLKPNYIGDIEEELKPKYIMKYNRHNKFPERHSGEYCFWFGEKNDITKSELGKIKPMDFKINLFVLKSDLGIDTKYLGRPTNFVNKVLTPLRKRFNNYNLTIDYCIEYFKGESAFVRFSVYTLNLKKARYNKYLQPPTEETIVNEFWIFQHYGPHIAYYHPMPWLNWLQDHPEHITKHKDKLVLLTLYDEYRDGWLNGLEGECSSWFDFYKYPDLTNQEVEDLMAIEDSYNHHLKDNLYDYLKRILERMGLYQNKNNFDTQALIEDVKNCNKEITKVLINDQWLRQEFFEEAFGELFLKPITFQKFIEQGNMSNNSQ